MVPFRDSQPRQKAPPLVKLLLMDVQPPTHLGLRHIALVVTAFAETKRFYTELLGFRIEWEPDEDNVYLTSGSDNLALHRAMEKKGSADTSLDHLGVLVRHASDVDAWAEFFENRGVTLASQPRTHRDGARSFYVDDPDGNRVQVIYHPPISKSS